jgi:uncharacterized membrane protein
MKKQRFWEIDVLRGFAIINMIIFNYSFALNYLGILNIDLGISYAVAIASTFIFISGISMTLSFNNNKKKYHKKFTIRGLKIFFWGLVITTITFFSFPEAFVVFGILHFIGVAVILGQFFLKFKKLNLILGLLILILGFYLQSFRFDFPWLLWLGFFPTNFFTFDYFPILPWFGVTLLGIFFGNRLYKNGKRSFKIKDLSNFSVVKLLSFLGKKSLFIYLMHQPVLILILLLLGLITI